MVEVGEVLLCVVEKINGTVVFVKMPNGKEGNIVLSEIAPGRIRNLRDYVFPGKNIVCKVLRVNGERVDLSLRRVTLKETKELRESLSLEKSLVSILKSILKEKAEEIIQKIKEEDELPLFLEETKKDPSKLISLVGKEDSEKILEILNAQKKKTAIVKKNFNLHSFAPNGIILIKKMLSEFQEVDIKYVAAGKYLISCEATDKKNADNKIKEVLDKIQEKSKKENFEFSVKEK